MTFHLGLDGNFKDYKDILSLICIELARVASDMGLDGFKASEYLSCCDIQRITLDEDFETIYNDDYERYHQELFYVVTVRFSCPVDSYKATNEVFSRATTKAVANVLKNNTTEPTIHGDEVFRVEFQLNPKWREESESQLFSNQNPYSKSNLEYEGLKFNSPAEMEVAKALDELGIMYFSNSIVRVGKPKKRTNRMPDFLICYNGKWGILEIDGKTYHTGRATDDYGRMRELIREGGIAHFDRYDTLRCQNNANEIVREFLEILSKK